MIGKIAAIYLTSRASELMQSVAEAQLESGKGIVGDRYHSRAGTFSDLHAKRGLDDCQMTLIETEEIDKFAKSFGLELGYGDLRRNIVTREVRLNALVGRQFRIGAVVLEGVRLCEPCAHLAALVSAHVLPDMLGRAGLRACIINGGSISAGDRVEVPAL